MVIGAEGYDLQTDKGMIMNTTQYKYLGVTLMSDGTNKHDLQNKVRKN